MAVRRGEQQHIRRRLRSIVFAPDADGRVLCYLCGSDIDMSLPAGRPGSPEMDDVVPVAHGGNPNDVNNLRPSHRRCNKAKGTMGAAAAMRNVALGRTTSRVW